MSSVFELVREPFPHTVRDGLWDPTLLEQVREEFPHPGGDSWIRYENEHEWKYHGDTPVWGSYMNELLGQFGEISGEISELFGIPELVMETVGGGMHLIPPGGYLRMHTDFNRSPDSGLYRRVNLLCFLNPSWMENPGGCLMLGRNREVVIQPEFNRTVIFESTDRSWHGHPEPNRRWRLSVAAYFFSREPPEGYREDHSTVWADG